MNEEKLYDNEKEMKIEDVLVRVKGYLDIADAYIEQNSDDKNLVHLGLLIDNISEAIDELKPYYDIINQTIWISVFVI